jgi:hypothetical protein
VLAQIGQVEEAVDLAQQVILQLQMTAYSTEQ